MEALAVKGRSSVTTKHKIEFNKGSRSKHHSFKTLRKHKITKKTSQHNERKLKNKRLKGESSDKLDEIDESKVKKDAVKVSKFVKKQHRKMKEDDRKDEANNNNQPLDLNSASTGRNEGNGESRQTMPAEERVVQEKFDSRKGGSTQDDYVGAEDERDLKDISKRQESNKMSGGGSTHVVFADRVAEENSTRANETKNTNKTMGVDEATDNTTKLGKLIPISS